MFRPRTVPRSSARVLLREWVVTVTVAEFVGFVAPALVGGIAAGWPEPLMAAVLVPAGAVEGAVLGWAQALVLRRVVPALAVARFSAATSVAAAFAYVIGSTPAVLAEWWAGLPLLPAVLLAMVAGGLLLVAIGLAQWWVLRRVVAGAAGWIAYTAAAWAAGLALFAAVTTPLWQPGQPLPLVVAIGLLGAVVMAVAVAAVTGVGVLRVVGSDGSGTRGKDLR